MERTEKTEPVSELQYYRGVGPRRAEALAAEGLSTPADVLRYFPRAYIDRNALQSLREMRSALLRVKQADMFAGEVALQSEMTVVAYVSEVRERTIGKNRSMVVVKIEDGSDTTAEIVFWNQAKYFKKIYERGQLLAISGKPEVDKYGKVSFHHPEIEKIEAEDIQLYKAGAIIPKYRSTQKLKNAGVTMRIMRTLVGAIIDAELPKASETLPERMLAHFGFPDIRTAYRQLHFPDSSEQLALARRRMKFEELFFFELLLALRHKGVKTAERSKALTQKSERARALTEALPFELTSAQKRVLHEIIKDLNTPEPMNRLLQGDVGSGKTIVALLAMLVAIDNGCQCVMMAPTEILAEQHFRNLSEMLSASDVQVTQLVGGQKTKARREILEQIATGKAHIVVGTHALFQSSVAYHKLALVVIDEQHRFGVMQRAELKKRATESFQTAADPTGQQNTDGEVSPHILVMSATPIPRTLSMTLYGDLDVSVIDELPKNRKPIKTKVVFESQIDVVYDFIRQEIAKGRQAYIVYPLVEKSEKLELKAATEHYETLQNEAFPGLSVGLLHGQMFWYEKEDAMKAFKDKEYDILVATTVVEVGIDIPNATVMLIENAERFGLSQLHQLRGRVGRGAEQSYCLLNAKDHFKFQLNKKRKDEGELKAAIIRLKTMQDTNDGFKIAEVDLYLRGPGDFLGTRQAGLPDFAFADLVNDGDIVALAREEAFALANADPQLRQPENRAVRTEYLRQYYSDAKFMGIA